MSYLDLFKRTQNHYQNLYLSIREDNKYILRKQSSIKKKKKKKKKNSGKQHILFKIKTNSKKSATLCPPL